MVKSFEIDWERMEKNAHEAACLPSSLCIRLLPCTDVRLVVGTRVVHVVPAIWPSQYYWSCQSCRLSRKESCSPPLWLADRCKRHWRLQYWTVESSIIPVMGSKFQPTHMLNSNEICANERDVIDLAESADDARMVNSRNKNRQKVGQESRLFLQIECQSFVITLSEVSSMFLSWYWNLHLNIGGSHNHVLKLVVFPGVRWTLYYH